MTIDALNQAFAPVLKLIRPTLGMTVYSQAPLNSIRAELATLYRSFLSRAEPRLRWYSDMKIDKDRRANARLLRYPFKWLDETESIDQPFLWVAHNALDRHDAPDCSFRAFLTDDPTTYMHQVSFGFPTDDFGADYSQFVAFVLEALSEYPLHYGYAGYIFNASYAPGPPPGVHLFYPAGMRFQGFELDRPNLTSFSILNKIKGVNWLTIIDDGFIDEMGGLEALRAKLSPSILLHKLPKGVIIQAGPAPSIGDVNAGDTLPLYREVARVLKPIRAMEHPSFLTDHLGRGGDTNVWLRRLND